MSFCYSIGRRGGHGNIVHFELGYQFCQSAAMLGKGRDRSPQNTGLDRLQSQVDLWKRVEVKFQEEEINSSLSVI